MNEIEKYLCEKDSYHAINASLGIDKELDCSYKPSTVLNWCGDNLYGFALRRWCNVNI